MDAAYLQGRPLVAELDTQSGDDITAFKARVDSLVPRRRVASRGVSPRAWPCRIIPT